MRRLIYALRFQGNARRIGIDGNVLQIASSASGCAFRARIGIAGLRGSLRPTLGDEATFESELVFTGETTFLETGTIVFGTGGHLLHVTSVGSGHLGIASKQGCRHGAAVWRINGGEGQFAGASGLITSNFIVGKAGEVTEYHLGVILVR
jgi:hypothetical protein